MYGMHAVQQVHDDIISAYDVSYFLTVSVFAVVVMLCLVWRRRRTNPLHRASQQILNAICARTQNATLCDNDKLSSRTRSRAHASAHMHISYDVRAREAACARVRKFATALRSLPLRNGHAIRRVGLVNLAKPVVLPRQAERCPIQLS